MSRVKPSNGQLRRKSSGLVSGGYNVIPWSRLGKCRVIAEKHPKPHWDEFVIARATKDRQFRQEVARAILHDGPQVFGTEPEPDFPERELLHAARIAHHFWIRAVDLSSLERWRKTRDSVLAQQWCMATDRLLTELVRPQPGGPLMALTRRDLLRCQRVLDGLGLNNPVLDGELKLTRGEAPSKVAVGKATRKRAGRPLTLETVARIVAWEFFDACGEKRPHVAIGDLLHLHSDNLRRSIPRSAATLKLDLSSPLRGWLYALSCEIGRWIPNLRCTDFRW